MWDSKESVYNIITKPALKKDPITVKTLLWRMKNNMKLRETATFGLLPGSTKPQPSKFLRKHSKEPNLTVKRTIATDRCTSKKAPLPDLTNQPPRYGIKSDTDYIYSNAERVIKAKADRSHCPRKEVLEHEKPGFGRLPMYLVKRKNEIAKIIAKGIAEKQDKCQHPGTRRLEGDEKQKIVNGLKIKWAVVNAEYLKLPFIADTDAQKIRKNRYEQELENLQRDISLLSRKTVLVADSGPSQINPSLM
ncbi:uncharacterized protein [Physcomitrium patens]|uniref:uncharacterized protein isoform X3 n=1 Tax=Physcomitrium patens TaxID=3218 RepID=UPI000D16A73E|nr:enkurin-like isoform X3 [Physcomitrium patens]|eukprot:XP_024367970.1 enkurin-like isoform X3 [Physcomitrella patens]